MAALHINGKMSDPREAEVARVERSGDISVIPAHTGLRVVDIIVERGVQTVYELHSSSSLGHGAI